MRTFDYIVVGAGSAGCVIASRLVEADKSVLLLETGPLDNHLMVHMPAGFSRVIGSKRTVMYHSEPQIGADGRRIVVPQARTVGGGSSVNGMIYIRGQPDDFDEWESLGCFGWSYGDVLPFFRKSEKNERLADEYHGTDGPLHVSDPKYRHPISSAFVRAAQQIGEPFNHDFNGASQHGVGFYQTTTFNSRRSSTAATFLKRVRKSRNLTLQTECHAHELLLENGAAVGLKYRDKAGTSYEVRAEQEVVLSAGTLATPKLLMLSGIGPADRLAELGLRAKRDLPGVGRNYHDHLGISVYGVTEQPISMLGQDKGWRAARNALQYALTGGGILASNIVEAGCFMDTGGVGRPDIVLNATPLLVSGEKRSPINRHGVSLTPFILRPTSRGKVSLRSADPADSVLFDPGVLQTEEDCATLVRSMKVARRILRTPAMEILGFSELSPEPGETIRDEDLRDYLRKNVKTVYHPAGTCKMGRDDLSVVDPSLRVIGVPRLRVADASIMPTAISGNTNAACIMIGERCADFILGQHKTS